MDDVAERGVGHFAVRIVGDDRFTGRRHRAAHDPVVAARIGRSSGCGRLTADAALRQDRGRGVPPLRVRRTASRSLRRAGRHDQRLEGIRIAPAVGLLGADLRDAARQLELARRVAERDLARAAACRSSTARGVIPVSTNSTGSLPDAVASAMNAFTPATYAVMIRRAFRVVGRQLPVIHGTAVLEQPRLSIARQPRAAPSTSARRPSAARRHISICHRRSWAITYPCAKNRSSVDCA